MLDGRRVTVGTTPTQLSPVGDRNAWRALIKVPSIAANPIDLGDDSVATGVGFEVGVGESLSVEFYGDEELYAVVSTGTVEVQLLERLNP